MIRTLSNVAFTLIFLAAVGLSAPGASMDKTTKNTVSLDGTWLFRTDPGDIGLSENWHGQPGFPKPWTRVDVPSPWDRFGLEDYDGAGWYQRTFTLTPDMLSKRLGVGILGVDDSAIVWINGREAARQSEYGRRFAFDVTDLVQRGENTITVRVFDVGGPGGLIGSVYIQPYERFEDLLKSPYADLTARSSADWVRDAVIYEAYVRSASPEGTFDGLRARLDELRGLGVTVVWLMPIHPVGKENRKGSLGSPYAIRDYYAVNPEFGTLEDFRALVAETHARGMKIIIDLVANHAAWDNPLTTEHPDWFTRDRDGNLRPPVPDWSDVAEFDFSNPGLRAYMAEMMLYWVRDVGVDGFRCDVAGLVPRDFWEAVRPKLDAVKPMLMLAEDDNPAMHLEAFDLTYDWRTYDHLGRLTAGKLTPQDIRNTLTDEDLLFPRASLRLRFSTNHDKNAWDEPAIQRYGPRAAKAAAVLIFALPGVPLIYNGQEVGNDRKLGLFERVSIDFSADAHGMREFYGSLGRLRAQRVSLRRGSCEVLCDLGAPGVVGLLRTAGEERTLVLINLRDQPAHARIDRLPVTRPLNALLVSDGVRVDSTTVVLPGYGYCFGEW